MINPLEEKELANVISKRQQAEEIYTVEIDKFKQKKGLWIDP
jgi:hypothetical protein